MIARTEFGIERASCSCRECRRNCIYIPGFLIPADLGRMIPEQVDPLVWAETNLLASPGAMVMKDFEVFRVPTLVPAIKPNGGCIHYVNRKCDIWEVSPFGCAFFGCGAQYEQAMSNVGLKKVWEAHKDHHSLYSRIWGHLWSIGKQQEPPEVLRARMTQGG